MKSAVVDGKIWHARLHPVKHAFEYPVYFFKIDVDELPEMEKACRFFGLNRWNVLSIREKDYLRPGSESLRRKTEILLAEQGIAKPAYIEVVTQLRYFGWVFNPVSFFFCRDTAGKLIAVIADVNNTFGEGHAYILKDFRELGVNRVEVQTPKVFHVSPFFDRKGEYRFEFTFHPEKVDIVLDYNENGAPRLASSWRGTCKPFSAKEAKAILLKYPFAGWLTILRIHGQAAILHFLKKLPIFKKPEPNHEMTIRKRPC